MRNFIEKHVLSACCRITGGKPAPGSVFRTRVFSGPLLGVKLNMPSLERLSFALGTYERHIVRCMKSHVSTGATAYDVGANVGYLTLVLSRLVGPSGKVVAFEPDPKNYSALRQNIADNKLTMVQSMQSAISDTSGDVTFATFDYSLVSHMATSDTPSDARLISVAAHSLDDLVYAQGFARPDFIKIDVEGGEEKVIRGALRLLNEIRPVVIVEVRPGSGYSYISNAFKNMKYVERPVTGGPTPEKDGYGDLLFIPR